MGIVAANAELATSQRKQRLEPAAQKVVVDVRNVPARIRYIIVNDWPLHGGRLLVVLMEPQSFSEPNLKEVFGLLSKRFPKPDQLWIGVGTSLQQFPTPEEFDVLKSTAGQEDLAFFENVDAYPSANYARFQGNESFDYTMGNGQSKKVVVIAGKDITTEHWHP
jgi:hypothetical protein